MRRWIVCLLFTNVCFATSARAGLDGFVMLFPITADSMQFRSWGKATCYDALGKIDPACTLSGSHEVNGPYSFTHAVTGAGQYNYDLSGPADAGACYRATLMVVADPPGLFNTIEGSWSTNESRCAPHPTSSGGDEVPQCGGGGPYEDCSPIVINFDGGYELTGANAPVWFDIKATGTPVLIGWTAGGSDEAFLWLDRNGNGGVDDGSELFGTATRLHDGRLAPNGFEALREFDGNRDSVIDADDAVWSELKLWRDVNHNGRSEADEISILTVSRVARLGLDYRWEGRRDPDSNLFKYQSQVWLTRTAQQLTPRPVYDLFFVSGTSD